MIWLGRLAVNAATVHYWALYIYYIFFTTGKLRLGERKKLCHRTRAWYMLGFDPSSPWLQTLGISSLSHPASPASVGCLFYTGCLCRRSSQILRGCILNVRPHVLSHLIFTTTLRQVLLRAPFNSWGDWLLGNGKGLAQSHSAQMWQECVNGRFVFHSAMLPSS